MPETREARLEAALRKILALSPVEFSSEYESEPFDIARSALATPPEPDHRDARIAQLEEALKAVQAEVMENIDCNHHDADDGSDDCTDTDDCVGCFIAAIIESALTGSTAEWLEGVKREARAEEVERMAGAMKKRSLWESEEEARFNRAGRYAYAAQHGMLAGIFARFVDDFERRAAAIRKGK